MRSQRLCLFFFVQLKHRFPQLRLWKLALVVLSIFAVQFVAGYLAGSYLDTVQPSLRADDWVENMYAMLDLWGSAIIFIVGGLSSYIFGGYLAGKLSPYRYLAPYSHAAIGSFIFVMMSESIFQFFKVCKCGPATFDDVGRIALSVPLTLGLSLGGTWLAIHTKVLKRLDALVSAASETATELSRNEKFNFTDGQAETTPSLADTQSVRPTRPRKHFGNKFAKRSRHKRKKGK